MSYNEVAAKVRVVIPSQMAGELEASSDDEGLHLGDAEVGDGRLGWVGLVACSTPGAKRKKKPRTCLQTGLKYSSKCSPGPTDFPSCLGENRGMSGETGRLSLDIAGVTAVVPLLLVLYIDSTTDHETIGDTVHHYSIYIIRPD
eukprot:g75445.t1